VLHKAKLSAHPEIAEGRTENIKICFEQNERDGDLFKEGELVEMFSVRTWFADSGENK
jgi:hypothetical protein